MLYLVLAIVSSVTMACVIKVSEGAGANRLGVAFVNYCIAAAVCFLLWLAHDAVPTSGLTAACGIFAGITWAVSLILIMYAIRWIGIAISSTVIRIAVVIPIILSILIWSEIPNIVQSAGIALAATAIVLLSLRAVRQEKRFHARDVLVVLAVWFAGGAAEFSNKLYAQVGTQEEKSGFLVVLFLVAAGFTLLWLKGTGKSILKKEFSYGIAVGVPNAFSGLFKVSALQVLPGTIVFPTIAAAGVLLAVLLGVLIWREKLGLKGAVGIAIAVFALILVNLKQ